VSYAGQLNKYYNNWLKITNDEFVLSCILGCKINFKSEPYQNVEPESKFSSSEELIIDNCIDRLLQIGAIELFNIDG